MNDHDRPSILSPLFSVIVPLYNDWVMLEGCLEALSEPTEVTFEVIVVDDGSHETAPANIRRWGARYPLTILREQHQGTSVARNRGIAAARGAVLVFLDADSRVQPGCLSALAAAVTTAQQHNFFQLCLIGDQSRLMGRAEELRLKIFQRHMLQTDGSIRYLNTAGFAVRRSRANLDSGLFDPIAVRGEDTLLLAQLILNSECPMFVPQATVQHAIAMPFTTCLVKDIRSAYLEGKTNNIIASKNVRIGISNSERLRLLWSMWKISREKSIGRAAWFVLLARESVERATAIAYRLFHR